MADPSQVMTKHQAFNRKAEADGLTLAQDEHHARRRRIHMSDGRPDRPDFESVVPADRTVLEDSGTAQVLLFMGWIPPLVTAVVSGVVVAFRTGSLGSLFAVVIGGTLAGYIASLVILFSVGHSLEQRGVGSRVAKAFVVFVLVVEVAAALWVAVTVDRGQSSA
jgi:hypothetical protein